jgi:Zn-dependent protease
MPQEPDIRWLPPGSAVEPPAPARAAAGGEPGWRQPEPGPAAPAPAPAPRERPRSGIRRWLYPAFVAGLVAIKFAAKLKGLLLLLPKLKVLTTAGSMVVSVGAYALLWGWKFAVGFVALLFVHEMGHYIQMRREGVQPSWMLFIPFLGAAVGARSLGGSALAEARVGLAGPVLGTVGCAVVAAIAFATDQDFWYALAFTGCLLNLFNLLPVIPLDGGRAMAAMAPWMWFVGFGIVVLLVFVWPNPIIILIAILGGFELYRRWRDRKKGEEGNAAYYSVSTRHRLAVGAVYVGLIVVLALGMDLTFIPHETI